MRIIAGLSVIWVAVFASIAHGQGPWEPETDLGGQFADIAVSGSMVHWVQGMGDISYRRSTDEGLTWSQPSVIGSGRIHLTKVIAAQDDDVWVLHLRDTMTFTDQCCLRTTENIYLLRSHDGGASWEPRRQLSTGRGAFRIHIGVEGDLVHIVWMDYRDSRWHVFYLRSLDRGDTWEPEVNLAPSVDGFGGPRPTLSVTGQSVHVVWGKKLDVQSEFSHLSAFDQYYRHSLDGGETWEPAVNLTDDVTAHSLRGTVASTDPGVVVVPWDDDRADLPVKQFARRSTDDGATWGAPEQLSFVDGDHGNIAAAGANMHIAWKQDDDSPRDIFYRLSTNRGATWGQLERVNTVDGSIASTPQMAASLSHLHLIWIDDRSGSWRTWYRRRDLEARLELSVDATCPAGGPIQIEWSGATPDGQIALIFARNTGSLIIPNNRPCAGTQLGLGSSQIQLAFQGSAGPDGARTLNTNAPRAACGGYLQLLDLTTCKTSNVVQIQ